MKKLVLFLFLSLAILANGKDCFTVVSVKIDGLPMALGQFSDKSYSKLRKSGFF